MSPRAVFVNVLNTSGNISVSTSCDTKNRATLSTILHINIKGLFLPSRDIIPLTTQNSKYAGLSNVFQSIYDNARVKGTFSPIHILKNILKGRIMASIRTISSYPVIAINASAPQKSIRLPILFAVRIFSPPRLIYISLVFVSIYVKNDNCNFFVYLCYN